MEIVIIGKEKRMDIFDNLLEEAHSSIDYVEEYVDKRFLLALTSPSAKSDLIDVEFYLSDVYEPFGARKGGNIPEHSEFIQCFENIREDINCIEDIGVKEIEKEYENKEFSSNNPIKVLTKQLESIIKIKENLTAGHDIY